MTTDVFTAQALTVLRTLTPSQMHHLDIHPLALSFHAMMHPDMAPDAFITLWEEARATIQADYAARRIAILKDIICSLLENPGGEVSPDPLPEEWGEFGFTPAMIADFQTVVTLVRAVMPPPEIVREPAVERKPRPIRVPLEEKTTERDTGDYTPDQIAEGFGVSLGSVHTWRARGCLETAADGQVREKIAARFLHHHPDEVHVTSTNGIWLDTLRALPKNGMRPSCTACRKAGRTAA